MPKTAVIFPGLSLSYVVAVGIIGAGRMSLSNQLRRRGLVVFFNICASVLIGCGGGNESETTDASQADGAATDTTAMPGMGSDLAGGADTMPGMTSSPDMAGSMPGGAGSYAAGGPAGAMAGPPGMNGAMPGGGADMAMAGGESSGGYPEGYPGANGGYPGGQVAAKPQRPGNFDAWTDDDYMSAAREHDPKLLDAIDFKVKSAPGDASVAVLLISLLDLQPLPATTNPNGGPAGYPAGYPGMPAGEMPNPGGSSAPGSALGNGPAPMGATPAPQLSLPPQASLKKESNRPADTVAVQPHAAVDSISAMILEASVTYMPQGAAVGAIAGGAQGRMEGLAGQAAAGSSTPQGYVPPGENSGATMPPGYPGGNPGGGYLGGNSQGQIGTPGSGQLQDRMLVEKVVDGLIVNNSKDAWQAIFGIVAGTVKTPLPAASNCEVVVERLFQNMDSNADVIQPVILAFLDSATPIPPESRTACMRMLAAISATQTDQLTGFAITSTPAAAAPGAANGYPGMSGGGESSFPGMGGAEGYPGMNGPGGSAAVLKKPMLPNVSLAPEVAAQGAAFLWNARTIAAIVAQLEKAPDLTTASDVLLLASTIPGDDIRHAIYLTFARLHEQGADMLNASGLFTDVHDPAMLTILKALPRNRPSKDTEGTLDSWSAGTQSLVLALRDELKRTAPTMKKYTDTLPVKLHKNATAEVSVMMQFPAASETARDAIPALTQVYYTRTSFTPQRIHDGEDLIKHYESKASGFDRPDQAKGLRWIEGVKVLQNGHRRTMDVIIEKAGNNAANGQMGFPGGGGESGYGGGAAGGGFSVEIIVVETVDPKNAADATAQASTER